jgi:palmitoyltransferase ZDHHC9/14/18
MSFFIQKKIGAQGNSTVADAIRDTPATIVEAVICFISIFSVIGLWSYHTSLICRSVTTNEAVNIRI